nr:DUF3558 domain-containing protein [Streptomyces sp. SID8379]
MTALLAGCTGSSDDGGGSDDSKPGEVSASASAAQPGKYRTLPEPCGQPESGVLDDMLPGIAKIADQEQREKAYEGTATTTFDTGRRVGCRWKDDASDGTVHRLTLDFERVVSYGTAASDDSEAQKVFASEVTKADLPEPTTTAQAPEPGSSADSGDSGDSGDSATSSTSPNASKSSPSSGKKGDSASTSGSGTASDPASPTSSEASADLQPRLLDGLGDEAFLDDALTGPVASRSRTVTVVFRTSNVVVTVEYETQPTGIAGVPDSKEMQDRAQELAQKLVGKFGE